MDSKQKSLWIHCLICGGKTRTKVYEDTVLVKFPLYCPKCKREVLIDVVKLKMSRAKSRTLKAQSLLPILLGAGSVCVYRELFNFEPLTGSQRGQNSFNYGKESDCFILAALVNYGTHLTHNGIFNLWGIIKYQTRIHLECANNGVQSF